jgi:hypothetical protein
LIAHSMRRLGSSSTIGMRGTVSRTAAMPVMDPPEVSKRGPRPGCSGGLTAPTSLLRADRSARQWLALAGRVASVSPKRALSSSDTCERPELGTTGWLRTTFSICVS